jgi:hypothetical protein
VARNNDLTLDQTKNGAKSIFRAFSLSLQIEVAARQDRYLEVNVYHIPGKIAKTIGKKTACPGDVWLNRRQERAKFCQQPGWKVPSKHIAGSRRAHVGRQ